MIERLIDELRQAMETIRLMEELHPQTDGTQLQSERIRSLIEEIEDELK